jgi:hypothetical protein
VLRFIDVQDFDVWIGIIVIPGSERFRGGTRVEFVCGQRALGAFRLPVGRANGPGAGIERVQSEAKELKRQKKELQARLAVHEGVVLASQAEATGSAFKEFRLTMRRLAPDRPLRGERRARRQFLAPSIFDSRPAPVLYHSERAIRRTVRFFRA